MPGDTFSSMDSTLMRLMQNPRATVSRLLSCTSFLAAYSLLLASLLPTQALASEGDAWARGARHAGVPVLVLHGIAMTESGKPWSDGVRRPWPWTLNSVKGPMFFATKDEAARVLESIIAEGIRNVDIGLMQVNWGYHHATVSSPAELLEPATNIRVASQILREAMTRTQGDVGKAVGAYHAGHSPERANRSIWYQNTVASFARRSLKHASGAIR